MERKVLFADTPGTALSLESNHLCCRYNEELSHIPLRGVRGIVLGAWSDCSSATLKGCFEHGIAVAFLNRNGELTGGFPSSRSDILLRRLQYKIGECKHASLTIARSVVQAKFTSQRTLLRNLQTNYPLPAIGAAIRHLTRSRKESARAATIAELLGIEGAAGHAYWGVFRLLLPAFCFETRSKNPPLTAGNALLSFGYTLLANELAAAATLYGLDIWVGTLHRQSGRYHSLAWDLVELLRAHYVDRLVLKGFHNLRYKCEDFEKDETGACRMNREVRKLFVEDLYTGLSPLHRSQFSREPLQRGVEQYIRWLQEAGS